MERRSVPVKDCKDEIVELMQVELNRKLVKSLWRQGELEGDSDEPFRRRRMFPEGYRWRHMKRHRWGTIPLINRSPTTSKVEIVDVSQRLKRLAFPDVSL